MSMVLNVDGMSCQHCVTSITAAVGTLPGVTGVTVDLANGAVSVAGEAAKADVIEAIEDCGYDVRAA